MRALAGTTAPLLRTNRFTVADAAAAIVPRTSTASKGGNIFHGSIFVNGVGGILACRGSVLGGIAGEVGGKA